MTQAPIKLQPLITSKILKGGVAIAAAFGPMLGGIIQNPALPEDQNLETQETLYVDLVNVAVTRETATCKPVLPGEVAYIPAGFTGRVSINAASTGHQFSGVILQPFIPGIPFEGNPWPPAGPTTLTTLIKAYLYQQYNDDEDMQVFFMAYNDMAAQYVDWFVNVQLPVYMGPYVSGALLDWVGEGLYGIARPVLPTGLSQNLGMFNTVTFNSIVFNEELHVGPPNYYYTDDDTYRRVLTWHLYKGDGKLFDIRWLKRRVERFLTGKDGGAGQTDQTYNISISFGVGNQVNINIQTVRRFATGGAVFGAGMLNTFQFNEYDTFAVHLPSNPMVPIFKAAVEAGVLELPFQFTWVVNIN